MLETAHPMLLSLAALLIALLLDAVWQWPVAYHPLSLFKILTIKMGDKVVPSQRYSPLQHIISGSLGAIFLVVPLCLLLLTIRSLAELPHLFDLLILLVIIDFGRVQQYYQGVLSAERKQQKLLARETLSKIVKRDTAPLSDIGIAKAAVEGLILRFHYQYMVTIILYLVAGSVVALAYRLLLEVAWHWHCRDPKFALFVRPVRAILAVIQGITLPLTFVLISLTNNPFSVLSALFRAPLRSISAWVLAAFGGALGIRLSGPAIYQGHKLRFAKVGGSKEIKLSDLVYAKRAVERLKILVIAMVMIVVGFAVASVYAADNQKRHQRIIALAPHLTEWVYSLGMENQLVAVSEYSDYPAAAKSLPRVANYQGADLKKIIALAPTLVLAWEGGNKAQDIARLHSLGINVFVSKPLRPVDIGEELAQLAELLGVPERGLQHQRELRKQLDSIRQAYQQTPKLRAFYYLWTTPLMTVGPNAWANQLLGYCNSETIFANAEVDYPQVSMKEVILRQPDILVAASSDNVTQQEIFWRDKRDVLKAPLITAEPDILSRFTLRLPPALAQLCESIHANVISEN